MYVGFSLVIYPGLVDFFPESVDITVLMNLKMIFPRLLFFFVCENTNLVVGQCFLVSLYTDTDHAILWRVRPQSLASVRVYCPLLLVR